MRWRDVWPLVKQTGTEFLDDKCPRLGAALAFYTALAIAPLLLMVIGIAGLAFGSSEAARREVSAQVADLVGQEQAETVEAMLEKSSSKAGGVLATVVGAVVLVFGATSLFVELREALDTVWNVKPGEVAGGVWGAVKARLLSLSVIGGMAFLLLASLVLSAGLAAVNGMVGGWMPYAGVWLQVGNQALSLLVTAVMFAMIFKVLPTARPAWSDVWVGAAVTAVLFTLGKYLIGLYLGKASVGSSFGAAGSFVVFLVWVYYSTQILLLGAEFTQVYALRHGSGLRTVEGLTAANPTGAGANLPPTSSRPATAPA